MPRNTSVILGDHLSQFVNHKINEGRFESSSGAVRAASRLLEEREIKLEVLRQKLAVGESQLDRGEGVDGETFIQQLME
jgi:antitoxin ParD1/3/4